MCALFIQEYAAGKNHCGKWTRKYRNWISHVIQWYFTIRPIVRFDKLTNHQIPLPNIKLKLNAWFSYSIAQLLFFASHPMSSECVCFLFKVCIFVFLLFYISSLHMRYMLMHSSVGFCWFNTLSLSLARFISVYIAISV